MGVIFHNGKEDGNHYTIIEYDREYIGVMEKKMETSIIYKRV